MKIEFNTTPKDFELMNAILGHAIDNIKERGDLKDYFLVDDERLDKLQRLRKHLVSQFIKAAKI